MVAKPEFEESVSVAATCILRSPIDAGALKQLLMQAFLKNFLLRKPEPNVGVVAHSDSPLHGGG